MNKSVVFFIFAICLTPVFLLTTDDGQCEEKEEQFTIKIIDAQGNDLSNPLFGGDVIVYFDTYDSKYGTLYKLKAVLSFMAEPAYVKIVAPGGQFQLSVSIAGAGSFLDETGLQFTASHEGYTYDAKLTKSGGYYDVFRNGANEVTLDPNIPYAIDAKPLNEGYISGDEPFSLDGMRITFEAIAAEGYHQVMFISEDEIVESYVVLSNYVINQVPSVSRAGYAFKGWFTPDGREIIDGYTVSPDEGDIIAYAEWEKNDSNNTIIYIAAGGGAGLLAAGLLLFLLKRRNSGEAN